LSADQRGQLDTTTDVKPIYDANGNIIGDDRERVMSLEKIDEFFRGVEGRSDRGGTPGAPAVAP
jgi:hypothetical protein